MRLFFNIVLVFAVTATFFFVGRFVTYLVDKPAFTNFLQWTFGIICVPAVCVAIYLLPQAHGYDLSESLVLLTSIALGVVSAGLWFGAALTRYKGRRSAAKPGP